MNSAMSYRQTSSETGNDLSKSDIFCVSSDEYEPSSSETDNKGSSYPDSESKSDKKTSKDVVPSLSTSAVFASWGPCTLQTPRFGFTGSTDTQSMKDKLITTEKDAGPATKIFKKKKDQLLLEKRQSE